MSSTLSSIFNGVKGVVSSTLPSDYVELSHVYDIKKNKFTGAEKRFGVIPRQVAEAPGVTKANTLEQEYSMLLTDSYISIVGGDSGIIDKIIELQGLFESVFTQLVVQKAGNPNCLLVSDFSVGEALVVQEEKLIIIEGSVKVRYRVNF